MTRRGWVVPILGFVGLAGVIGAACGGMSRSSTAAGPARSQAGGVAGKNQFGPAPGAATSGTASGPPGTTVAGETLAPVQQRIVKTAQVTLQLKDGAFAQQFQQASLIAARHGGYVASSETNQGTLRSGTVVLRVPADQFETALVELKSLGMPKSEMISGQDVTGQFVDLQARLRNWEAQESVLLKLMAKATSIDDSIKVQRQLQDVQLSIEEIRGELHALTDQADLSTISLSMAEARTILVPQSASTLSKAWRDAVHGFVAVIASVVVGLGYLVPLALIALALMVARRVGFRRTRPGVAEASGS